MTFCSVLHAKNSLTLPSVHRSSLIKRDSSANRTLETESNPTVSSIPQCRVILPVNYKEAVQRLLKWEVKSLPFKFELESQQSPVIARYLSTLQNKHNDLISKMDNELKQLANEISEEIRRLGEDYQIEINACKEVIKIQWEKLEYISYEDLGSETEVTRSLVYEMTEKQRELLDIFYEDLNNCEQKRSNKMKRIFFRCNSEMEKIGYIMPFEVQKYFETLILHANQQLLSNASVVNELYTIFSKSISKSRCSFNKRVKNITRNAARDTSDEDRRMKERMKRKTIEQPMVKLQEAILDLEILITQVQQGLRASVNMLFWDMQGSLRYRKSFQSFSAIKDTPSIVSDLLKIPAVEPFIISNYNQVEKIKQFLNEALEIWDHHWERIENEEERILKEIEANSVKTMKNLDDKLNKSPAVLTQITEGDAGKVKKVSGTALKNIKTLESLIATAVEKELNILNSFTTFCNEESVNFVQICSNFLTINKRESINEYSMESSLPLTLRAFQYNILALFKWKTGLYSAIQANITNSANRLEGYAKEFIDPVSEKITEKYESYTSKLKVIEFDISNATEIRTAELKFHDTRTKEHCTAIKKILKNLKKNFKKAPDKVAYKQQCVDKVQYLQRSNDKFLAKIQQFPEGNFTPSEVKKITKKVSKNTAKLKTEETKWSS